MNSRAVHVGGFNFKGSDQQKKVGKLSGGERNRLHLAKLLRSGGNLLLLDEPTNDLDVDTLRALEEALLAFAGCAVVISHDRWFLDRIATHVLAFEGDSQVTWFEGNFEAYEEHRRELLGDEADRPHRITYKKLSAQLSALVAIEHFTDPTCPWAFSAEPQRWRLRWLYGDQLAWTDRMVVLSEDAAEVEAVFPPEIHARAMAMIQQRFGMPIDTGERARSAASAPACAAVVATRLNASPEQAESLLRALRVRIMGGELPTTRRRSPAPRRTRDSTRSR